MIIDALSASAELTRLEAMRLRAKVPNIASAT